VDYIALYPAGTTSLVAEALRGLLPGAEIRESDDSALAFAAPGRLRSAAAVPFVKNLFAVGASTRRRGLDASLTELAGKAQGLRRPPGATAFRVMFHIDGQLVSPSPAARQRLERAIGAATGLRPEPRGRCQEYWVIGRRVWQSTYLGERLPPGHASPALRKGALSPELSALLVSLSRPDPSDVFLDPFAGSGSLVAARLGGPARKIIYNDRADAARRSAAARLGHKPGLVFLHEDGTAMTSLQPGEISAVVTDPPWGEYDDSVGEYDDSVGHYAEFAGALAAELARLLHPRVGRLVLLTSRRREPDWMATLVDRGLAGDPPIEILVNGHPASVLRAYPPTR
jgi:hypothetical protein